MKHLKIFESNNYYRKIEYEDYIELNRYLRKMKAINISQECIDLIRRSGWSHSNRKPSIEGVMRTIIDTDPTVYISYYTIKDNGDVYELEDEWFIVHFKTLQKNLDGGCYLCDQLEGLRKLLNI